MELILTRPIPKGELRWRLQPKVVTPSPLQLWCESQRAPVSCRVVDKKRQTTDCPRIPRNVLPSSANHSPATHVLYVLASLPVLRFCRRGPRMTDAMVDEYSEAACVFALVGNLVMKVTACRPDYGSQRCPASFRANSCWQLPAPARQPTVCITSFNVSCFKEIPHKNTGRTNANLELPGTRNN